METREVKKNSVMVVVRERRSTLRRALSFRSSTSPSSPPLPTHPFFPPLTMVSTRSGSPSRHPPPPTPTSGTIPLRDGSPSASTSTSVPSSTSGPAPPPPSQPSLSLDAILSIIQTTDATIPQACHQLQKTLDGVAQSTEGDIVLSSFLQDPTGKPTIDPLAILDPRVHSLGFLYIL